MKSPLLTHCQWFEHFAQNHIDLVSIALDEFWCPWRGEQVEADK